MTRTIQTLDSHRVTTVHGTGTVAYTTRDGWVGVRLDGEKRVDEYPIECVEAVSIQS